MLCVFIHFSFFLQVSLKKEDSSSESCSDDDEWTSDSSFEYNKKLKMKKYVVAKYENVEHPFEITDRQRDSRVMKGHYFQQKTGNQFVKEQELLLVKKKRFVRNLKDPILVRVGSKRASNLYSFPDFLEK